MERILGHVVGSKVGRVYDRALWMKRQREVLDSWSRKLATITQGGAQVFPMTKVAEHA